MPRAQERLSRTPPSLYYSASLKVLLDLHVDDGYASGPAESLNKVFGYLATVLVLKISPLVKYGMAFDHVGTTRYRTSEGMWIQTHDKYVAKVLDMMGMTTCNAPPLRSWTRRTWTATTSRASRQLCFGRRLARFSTLRSGCPRFRARSGGFVSVLRPRP